ncbi:MAG: sortase [Candidatus Peribacteria bacterium]|nr:sortase [Candidatus Peribacteria bacterium]
MGNHRFLYLRADDGKYKTVFQSIIGLAAGDRIRIYQKEPESNYTQYIYTVEKSYEITPRNIQILDATTKKMLTLITCTPLGGTSGRCVVKARFEQRKELSEG